MKTLSDERILELLRLSEQDPMWADHAEISKFVLQETIKLITRQKAALGNCHKEIFKLRDALLTGGTGYENGPYT